MKKLFLTLISGSLMIMGANAQTKINDKTTTYNLNSSTLHEFQTGDPMGNVSFIIEGEKGLIILEQPMFWESVNEFNSYVESLGKPVEKVIANYHSLGLADYQPNKVMMPQAMIGFNKSDMAQGMIAKFESNFGEKADFRPYKKAKAFDVPSTQNWAGVDLQFYAGAPTDFPAASILIDKKAYYTHFAPSISHANPIQVRSRESVDAILAELYIIKNSGAQYIFGSHGKAATQADVEFQIEYFEKIIELLSQYNNSDQFGQRLILAYPKVTGLDNVKAISKALYPDEDIDATKEKVRKRMNDYLSMVSNIDENIAKGLWADDNNISIVTPRGHFVGLESIMNDFLRKAFSSFKSRKLTSLSEVINVYSDSANVQLYWNFDTVDADGVARQGRGRESLIFAKIKGEWRLVHVHYSPLPQ